MIYFRGTAKTYLVLRVERHDGGFVRADDGLAGANHPVVCFGGELVGEEEEDEASLEEVLGGG